MIAALVLAAGRSSRYGRADKLLARVHGSPLLSHTLRPIVASGLRPIVVVTRTPHGRTARLVRAELGHRGFSRIVPNSTAGEGLASSLRRGVAALPTHCDAVMIFLGDTPPPDSRTITRLIRAWRPNLDYMRPTQRDRPRHPVLMSHRLFRSMGRLEGDRGAQHALEAVSPSRAARIEMPTLCMDDVDTPAMLRRLQSRLRQRRCPDAG